MMVGATPGLEGPAEETLSRPCIMEMQRRPLPERFLVVEVDSTVELPSEVGA